MNGADSETIEGGISPWPARSSRIPPQAEQQALREAAQAPTPESSSEAPPELWLEPSCGAGCEVSELAEPEIELGPDLEAEATQPAAPDTTATPSVEPSAQRYAAGSERVRSDIERLRGALFFIPADDRETWVRMAMAVKSELGDAGFDIWDAWNWPGRMFPRLPVVYQRRLLRAAFRSPAVRVVSLPIVCLAHLPAREARPLASSHCSPAAGLVRCWPAARTPRVGS
jgi:hypothetical protein